MNLSAYVWALMVLSFSALAAAEVHEARVPLPSHKLRLGVESSPVVAAINKSLGDGAYVGLSEERLLLRVDPRKLPRSFDALRSAARAFAATAAPQATAAQRRMYGLFLPGSVDPHKPMVVLVHGLDCNRSNWTPMADLLAGEGYQVAYFAYPSDQPLEESAAELTRHMIALRQTFADLPLDFVAHSMGALIARRYVEGDDYAGGVRHLIMLGPPNLGTRWAAWRMALEAQEHYSLWRHHPEWCASWMITDGLGEAGRDLKPSSRFLAALNDRPRRGGVKYCIIAGAQHPIAPIAASAIDSAAGAIPERAARWWGLRHAEAALHGASQRLRQRVGKSDGPVRVSSTQLAGVSDHVLLSCDHASLYYPCNGQAPAAWDVIRDRLSR